jgi:hypothetical protein
MPWHEGDRVVVDPVDPERDPYIFQFQDSGTITRRTDRGYMIELHSAVGEWGPVPAERLRRPR